MLHAAEIWLLSFFLEEALWSCCVKPFPVWVSCDSGQGTGIGTDQASELHENFPLSLTACALYALFTCDCVCVEYRRTHENGVGTWKLVCLCAFLCCFRWGRVGGDIVQEEKG